MNTFKTKHQHLSGTSNFPFTIITGVNKNNFPLTDTFNVMHQHNELQIIYVESGQITVQLLNEKITVHQGNAIFIYKNIMHTITNRENCQYKSIIFPEQFITFYSGSLAEQSALSFLKNFEHQYFIINKQNDALINTLNTIQQIIALDNQSIYYAYNILLLLSTIFLDFLKYIPTKEAISSVQSERLNICLQFIHTNYQSNISLQDIALSSNISKSECLRCFKNILNTTPYAYLIELRLSKAATLLKTTNLSITTIALNCGFQHFSQFSQLFKRKTNLSPKKYKTLHNTK